MSDPIYVRRSQVADLIESLRLAELRGRVKDERDGHPAFPGQQAERANAVLRAFVEWCERRNVPPLEPCDDPTHQNAYEDHCVTCMPRWGAVGPEVKVR
jgi:hypothetical protein